MDVMGCIIMACASSMGGGTLRDVLLAHDENGTRPFGTPERVVLASC